MRKNNLGVVDPELERIYGNIERALYRIEERLSTEAERERFRTVVRAFWAESTPGYPSNEEEFWEEGNVQGVVALLENTLEAHGFIGVDESIHATRGVRVSGRRRDTMGTHGEGPFRVEVIADETGEWIRNQLTFPTREAAEQYGRDLASRWMAVQDWRVVEDKPGAGMGISRPERRREQRRERRHVTGPGYDMNLPSMPPFMYVEGHRKLGDLGVIAFGAYNAMGLIGTEGGGVAIVVEEPEKMVLATKTIPWDPPGRAAEAKEVADLIDEMMREGQRGRKKVRFFPADRKQDLVSMLQERGYGVRGFGG